MIKTEGKEMNFFEELDYEYNRAKKFMNKVKPHHYIMGFFIMFAMIGFVSYFGATLVSMFVVAPFLIGSIIDGEKIKGKWAEASKTQKGMAIGGGVILAPFILIGALWLLIFGLLYSPLLVLLFPLPLVIGFFYFRKKEGLEGIGKFMGSTTFGIIAIAILVIIAGISIYNYTTADDQDGMDLGAFFKGGGDKNYQETLNEKDTVDLAIKIYKPTALVNGTIVPPPPPEGHGGNDGNDDGRIDDDDEYRDLFMDYYEPVKYADVYLFPYYYDEDSDMWKTDYATEAHYSIWESDENGDIFISNLPRGNYTILITRSGYEPVWRNVIGWDWEKEPYIAIPIYPICWKLTFDIRIPQKELPNPLGIISEKNKNGKGVPLQWLNYIQQKRTIYTIPETNETTNETIDVESKYYYPKNFQYGFNIREGELPYTTEYNLNNSEIRYTNESVIVVMADGNTVVFDRNSPAFKQFNATQGNLSYLATMSLKITSDNKIEVASTFVEKYLWFAPLTDGNINNIGAGGQVHMHCMVLVNTMTPYADNTNMVINVVLGFDNLSTTQVWYNPLTWGDGGKTPQEEGGLTTDGLKSMGTTVWSSVKSVGNFITDSIGIGDDDSPPVPPPPADTDMDGVPDIRDAFPNDPINSNIRRWVDTDGDGIANYINRKVTDTYGIESWVYEDLDEDDDNDGYDDEYERNWGSDPNLASSTPKNTPKNVDVVFDLPLIDQSKKYEMVSIGVYPVITMDEAYLLDNKPVYVGESDTQYPIIFEGNTNKDSFTVMKLDDSTYDNGRNIFSDRFQYSFIARDRTTKTSHMFGMQITMVFAFREIGAQKTTDSNSFMLYYTTPIYKLNNPYDTLIDDYMPEGEMFEK